MQNAKTELSILKQKSEQNENYIFDRLYRNLYKEDFFLRAYQKLYSKEGNMTPGIDDDTIDGFSKQHIAELIELLKHERYYPKPARRTYIHKKHTEKMRPLGIPTFTDKLIQEVLREILEAIYEPIFCDCSHGFRPNRSCHTALDQVKKKGKGTNWVIEGDLTQCFESISHELLLKVLSLKISDGRFLELIRRFLKAGYFEFKQVHNSLSGTPQGSVLSPILSNIFLHEFDKYMEKLVKGYIKGTSKRDNPPYRDLYIQKCCATRQGRFKEAKELLKQMRTLHAVDPMDDTFIRVSYTRYADDFLVCVIGSKSLACEIKGKMAYFLEHSLGLELNREKTSITNLANERVRFVGYEVSKAKCDTKLTKNVFGHKRRSINGLIELLVPNQVIRDKTAPFRKGRVPYPFKARSMYPILDIINMYNAEIRGLYNFYCLAVDVNKKLEAFKYFHYGSMLKTIAGKEKSTVNAVVARYGVVVPRKAEAGTMRVVGVHYDTKAGEKTMTYFNERLVRVERPVAEVVDFYGQPFGGGQLLKRFNAGICELCGSIESVVVHHVRKLKEVKQKYRKHGRTAPDWVLVMARINRKTLVVCHSCHVAIHNGTCKSRL